MNVEFNKARTGSCIPASFDFESRPESRPPGNCMLCKDKNLPCIEHRFDSSIMPHRPWCLTDTNGIPPKPSLLPWYTRGPAQHQHAYHLPAKHFGVLIPSFNLTKLIMLKLGNWRLSTAMSWFFNEVTSKDEEKRLNFDGTHLHRLGIVLGHASMELKVGTTIVLHIL